MTDGAPAESHGTGSQIHPLLRQRMLNRAATFSEGAQHHPLPRRRSSLLSDYSDTRHSFRSSTDNLLRPSNNNDMEKLASTDETSFWHSAPLVFAILPAVSGLLFQNGSSIVTDILLLGFGSMFLNWCVRAPWDWYHAAQQVQYFEPDESLLENIIPEEDEESYGTQDEEAAPSSEPTSPVELKDRNKEGLQSGTDAQRHAQQELRKEEIVALVACFIGPLLGTYLLHTIRSQLTRPAEGLVSNYNLTIFAMAAELRPVAHVIKMKQARTLHLQRIARPDSNDRLKKTDAQEISRKLSELEERMAEPTSNTDIEITKIGATIRQGMQPQLDALNRAVRRYEKRQAAQSIQIEARFQELESRLKDALSLAAAAARHGQQPGIISMVVTWAASVVTHFLQICWAILTYPFRTTAALINEAKSWAFKPERQPRKRNKGHSNGHTSISAPRMQSRSGR